MKSLILCSALIVFLCAAQTFAHEHHGGMEKGERGGREPEPRREAPAARQEAPAARPEPPRGRPEAPSGPAKQEGGQRERTGGGFFPGAAWMGPQFGPAPVAPGFDQGMDERRRREREKREREEDKENRARRDRDGDVYVPAPFWVAPNPSPRNRVPRQGPPAVSPAAPVPRPTQRPKPRKPAAVAQELPRLTIDELSAEGVLRWPALLLTENYQAQRDAMQLLITKRANQNAVFSKNDLTDAGRVCKQLIAELNRHVKEADENEWMAADRFLRHLTHEVQLPPRQDPVAEN